MASKLDIAFQEAYEKASNFNEKLPPDTMLKLYAYYKQATVGDNIIFYSDNNVRNGFKLNAWTQLRGLSTDEAKKEYIKLVSDL